MRGQLPDTRVRIWLSTCVPIEQLCKGSEDRRTASLPCEFWDDVPHGFYLTLSIDISGSCIPWPLPPLNGECESWSTRQTPEAADRGDSQSLVQFLYWLHEKWRNIRFRNIQNMGSWTIFSHTTFHFPSRVYKVTRTVPNQQVISDRAEYTRLYRLCLVWIWMVRSIFLIALYAQWGQANSRFPAR